MSLDLLVIMMGSLWLFSSASTDNSCPQPLICQPHNNLCNNLRYGQTRKSSHLFVMGMNTGTDIDVRGAYTVITWLYTCRWQQNANARRQEMFQFWIYSKFYSNLFQRLYKNSALFHLQASQNVCVCVCVCVYIYIYIYIYIYKNMKPISKIQFLFSWTQKFITHVQVN
jgi:hypothetical protein